MYNKLYFVILIDFEISATVFVAICCIFNLSLLVLRVSRKIDTADPDAQSTAIFLLRNCLTRNLCPAISEHVPDGRLYYPQGFYRLSLNFAYRFTNLFKFEPSKKLPKELVSIAQILDNSTRSAAILNVIIFPLLAQVAALSTMLLVFDNSIFSLLIILFSLLLIDSLFPSANYAFSTRSIGFSLVYIMIFSLISSKILLNSELLATHSYIFLLKPILETSLFTIFTSCLFILLLSSQQGSQFFISFAISVFMLNTSEFLFNDLIIMLVTAFFLQLQFPWLSTISYYKTHFLNRAHEIEWSSRTYGIWRYKLFNLTAKDTRNFLKSIFTASWQQEDMASNLWKKSWIAQLASNRIYLYALFLIVYLGIDSSSYGTLLLNNPINYQILIVIFAAAIGPSIICCFKPFQGYGPPLHYIDFYTPLMWLSVSSCCLILKTNVTNNYFFNLLVIVLVVEVLLSLPILIKRYVNIARCNLTDLPDKLSLLNLNRINFIDCLHPKANALLTFLLQLKLNKSAKAVVLDTHWSAYLEVTSVLRSRIYPDRPNYSSIVPMVDSNSYSFYSYYRGFSNDINRMPWAKDIDFILLDLDRFMDVQLYKSLGSQGRASFLKIGHNLVVAICK